MSATADLATAAPPAVSGRISLRFRLPPLANKIHHFKTMAGARRFAQRYVGTAPDFEAGFAVSADDRRTTIECIAGCTMADLFTIKGADR